MSEGYVGREDICCFIKLFCTIVGIKQVPQVKFVDITIHYCNSLKKVLWIPQKFFKSLVIEGGCFNRLHCNQGKVFCYNQDCKFSPLSAWELIITTNLFSVEIPIHGKDLLTPKYYNKTDYSVLFFCQWNKIYWKPKVVTLAENGFLQNAQKSLTYIMLLKFGK